MHLTIAVKETLKMLRDGPECGPRGRLGILAGPCAQGVRGSKRCAPFDARAAGGDTVPPSASCPSLPDRNPGLSVCYWAVTGAFGKFILNAHVRITNDILTCNAHVRIQNENIIFNAHMRITMVFSLLLHTETVRKMTGREGDLIQETEQHFGYGTVRYDNLPAE